MKVWGCENIIIRRHGICGFDFVGVRRALGMSMLRYSPQRLLSDLALFLAPRPKYGYVNLPPQKPVAAASPGAAAVVAPTHSI